MTPSSSSTGGEILRDGPGRCRGIDSRRLKEGPNLPDLDTVVDALVWSRGTSALRAEELWVDETTLRARLDIRNLHPAEHATIIARVSAELGSP